MVFITVKHGANVETLFNQDCKCAALLRAIRDKCCNFGSSEIIDLSDKDGNVKDLRKYPNMTAKEVLADREDCVLIRVGEKLAKGSKRDSSKQKSTAGRGLNSGGGSGGGGAGSTAGGGSSSTAGALRFRVARS
uniref:DWNN domain-containing protein n=1 Tax=Macrostomum lignano TaxID=282301 RepID=A0A1I8J155_9PLAT